MDIENFKLLREHVAGNPKFDMENVLHWCGSAACIMGSAEALIIANTDRRELRGDLYTDDQQRLRVHMRYIKEWLGIETSEYLHIYVGGFSKFNMDKITQEEAVDYLDRCIELGCVCVNEPSEEMS